MSIREDVRSKMYSAMKANNKADKTIYSMLLDNILKAEKSAGHEFTDDEVGTVVLKQIKQCCETLMYAEKVGNHDVTESIKREIELLKEFTPQMMTEDDIRKLFVELCASIEPVKKNKGLFMKAIREKAGSRADMKMVSQFIDVALV